MALLPSRWLAVGIALAALICNPPTSPAQTGVIKVVVPVPPGSAGDLIARLLTDQVGRLNNRSFVIEPRPGAGTMIGTEAVARAPANGQTLLINAPFLLIGPHLRKLSFDPLASLDPVCYLVSSPGVLAVNAASPYRTFADLMEAVRTRPGQLTFASAGPGSTHQVGFEKLKHDAGLDFTYVPFSGGGPAINALLGNHVTAVLAEYAPLSEHLKAGTLRPLAVTSTARVAGLPGVPTIAETYPGFEVDFWWGLFAPAHTPDALLSQLAEWFTAAMQKPEVKAKLNELGFFPAGICGQDFAALLRKQYEDYGRVIRSANMRTD
ncbi:MAG TPA: tripartite tricarboxylate transporter substrate binding protein [Xanthobacteraceae bacterium]|jgi:tripartite-type tricarboxylate transporter receptor subunit TctC|nr:tripartite tricarboxylate transporter substrate binding protein [Xanthobacteraceae bacterium]